mmetsp:Transcript_7525/g.21307  ORF Transcript_7525/g.21307 Transcript_7525/m.21307 type:complete len:203 (+) Transcript_7525:1345-1953(+)
MSSLGPTSFVQSSGCVAADTPPTAEDAASLPSTTSRKLWREFHAPPGPPAGYSALEAPAAPGTTTAAAGGSPFPGRSTALSTLCLPAGLRALPAVSCDRWEAASVACWGRPQACVRATGLRMAGGGGGPRAAVEDPPASAAAGQGTALCRGPAVDGAMDPACTGVTDTPPPVAAPAATCTPWGGGSTGSKEEEQEGCVVAGP